MNKNIVSFLLFMSLFLTGTPVMCGSEYILYVRARGELGRQLSTYWKAVKEDSSISHSAITDFPPHCSLTGFFPMDKSKNIYVQAVENALLQLGSMPRTITINRLVQSKATSNLDYIQLTSAYLTAVTKKFMSNASVPQKYLKGPEATVKPFTFHITLRDHVFTKDVIKKMKAIQSLERQIQLNAPVVWSLFLYERDDAGHLTMIQDFPL